jgi:hypothetical protein
MKLDRFTWAVIGVVVVLLVAAVVTVNVTGGAGIQPQEYLASDTPEAPVYNAFLAFQRGDLTKAREQYSKQVLEDYGKDSSYDPLSQRNTTTGSSQRLRILKTDLAADDPDRAIVSFMLDTYNQGGPFGAGSTYGREGTVEVVREEDGWKINTQELFW